MPVFLLDSDWSILFIFMPDGCTFNGKQNIFTDEQFASYEIGEVLD
ncbi:MAG: hypothetical protein OXC27_06265 [Caldilineaceae bacterium]|nr:hypothetical protein [Caldilineaceae bacterium]